MNALERLVSESPEISKLYSKLCVGDTYLPELESLPWPRWGTVRPAGTTDIFQKLEEDELQALAPGEEADLDVIRDGFRFDYSYGEDEDEAEDNLEDVVSTGLALEDKNAIDENVTIKDAVVDHSEDSGSCRVEVENQGRREDVQEIINELLYTIYSTSNGLCIQTFENIEFNNKGECLNNLEIGAENEEIIIDLECAFGTEESEENPKVDKYKLESERMIYIAKNNQDLVMNSKISQKTDKSEETLKITQDETESERNLNITANKDASERILEVVESNTKSEANMGKVENNAESKTIRSVAENIKATGHNLEIVENKEDSDKLIKISEDLQESEGNTKTVESKEEIVKDNSDNNLGTVENTEITTSLSTLEDFNKVRSNSKTSNTFICKQRI